MFKYRYKIVMQGTGTLSWYTYDCSKYRTKFFADWHRAGLNRARMIRGRDSKLKKMFPNGDYHYETVRI